MGIVLISKARQLGLDAFPTFRKAKRVFFGYVVESNDDNVPDPSRDIRKRLVNLSEVPLRDWKRLRLGRGYSATRNSIQTVKRELDNERGAAIVMIPRPSNGKIWLGRITPGFEIVNNPLEESWISGWLDVCQRARSEGKLKEEVNPVPEVAQGWRVVGGYKRFDLSQLPGWLHRLTMFRQAVRVLATDTRHPLDDHGKNREPETAYSVLDGMLRGEERGVLTRTFKREDIKRRLVDVLNPYSFENLIVSLLQLGEPETRRQVVWRHTGGPGDGGIDGIGSREGKTVGVLQTKFHAWDPPRWSGEKVEGVRRYVAVLLLERPPPSPRRCPDGSACLGDGSRLLDLDWVAERVQAHWRQLPLAQTIRVNPG